MEGRNYRNNLKTNKIMKQTVVEWLEFQIEILLMDGYKFDSIEVKELFEQANKMSDEELLTFGKSCFYKGFEKAEKDDANCYTAFREEIGGLILKFKTK
jgi:hypothetical protein